jgi:hypothetical protein
VISWGPTLGTPRVEIDQNSRTPEGWVKVLASALPPGLPLGAELIAYEPERGMSARATLQWLGTRSAEIAVDWPTTQFDRGELDIPVERSSLVNPDSVGTVTWQGSLGYETDLDFGWQVPQRMPEPLWAYYAGGFHWVTVTGLEGEPAPTDTVTPGLAANNGSVELPEAA